MSVVLVGTGDAPVALQTDSQMSSRFEGYEIPRWRENDDFRRLLSAFERVIPIRKASNLAQQEIAQFLLARSGGLTGEVSRMLNDAAESAIADGSEQITLALLREVSDDER